MSHFARRYTTLIVDDSPTIVQIVEDLLVERFGDVLNVVRFTDPLEARDYIEDSCVDILITDVEMPGLNGLELLQLAKRRNGWTQVIVMTAHSSCERVLATLQQGALDYLMKPINAAEFTEVFQRVLDLQHRWQQMTLRSMQRA
jgi:DNA-binding NtrC family response regulator